MATAPSLVRALQLVEARDGVSVEAMVSIKEPTRIRIDGAPIVVILTALNGSMNTKTGHMTQSYILRADIDPVKAARLGLDASICGDCQHRPTNAKKPAQPRVMSTSGAAR